LSYPNEEGDPNQVPRNRKALILHKVVPQFDKLTHMSEEDDSNNELDEDFEEDLDDLDEDNDSTNEGSTTDSQT